MILLNLRSNSFIGNRSLFFITQYCFYAMKEMDWWGCICTVDLFKTYSSRDQHFHLEISVVSMQIQCSLSLLFNSVSPSQQFFIHVRTGLHGLNLYSARINVPCLRTQCSDACEVWTRNPSVSSQALYH